MNNATCVKADCANKPCRSGGGGLCGKHYRERLNAGQSCLVDACGRPVIYGGMCKAHNHRKARGTLDRVELSPRERFESMTIQQAAGCWIWLGTMDRYGYGVARFDAGRSAAHRYAYILYVGPLAADATIDHLCHTASRDTCPGGRDCPHRRCVNPAHLQPMSAADNGLAGNSPPAINARKTACVHGHPFDTANTTITAKGYRVCRACKRARNARSRVA